MCFVFHSALDLGFALIRVTTELTYTDIGFFDVNTNAHIRDLHAPQRLAAEGRY